MNIIIVSIHVTAAIILVLTVLLQAGKGSGMGAAFGGASGSVFGARGPATLISKITCAAAVIFMITSLNLALSQSGGARKGSIMDDYQAAPVAASTAASPQPALDSQATAEQPAAASMPVVPEEETAPAQTDAAPVASSENVSAPADQPNEE